MELATVFNVRCSKCIPENRSDLGRQTSVGYKQCAIGPQALAHGGLADRFEQEWSEWFSSDSPHTCSSQCVVQGGLKHMGIEGVVGRY